MLHTYARVIKDLCWSLSGHSTLLRQYFCLLSKETVHCFKYSNFVLCFAINRGKSYSHLILVFVFVFH